MMMTSQSEDVDHVRPKQRELAPDQSHPSEDLKNSLTQLCEEVYFLRMTKKESEERMRHLLTDQHKHERHLEEEILKNSSLKENHEQQLADLDRSYQEQISHLNREKSKLAWENQSWERDIKSVKDEVRSLQLEKYNLERMIREQGHLLKTQTNASESHLKQAASFEDNARGIKELTERCNTQLSNLAKEVKEATVLNERLSFVNSHHRCVKRDLEAKLEAKERVISELRIARKANDVEQLGSGPDPRDTHQTVLLQERLEKLKKNEEVLKKQLEHSRMEHQESVKQFGASQQLIESYLSSNQRYKDDLERLDQEKGEMTEKLEQLEGKGYLAEQVITKLQQEKEDMETSSKQKIEFMEEKICSLRKDVEASQEINQVLENKNRLLQEEHTKSLAALSSIQQQQDEKNVTVVDSGTVTEMSEAEWTGVSSRVNVATNTEIVEQNDNAESLPLSFSSSQAQQLPTTEGNVSIESPPDNRDEGAPCQQEDQIQTNLPTSSAFSKIPSQRNAKIDSSGKIVTNISEAMRLESYQPRMASCQQDNSVQTNVPSSIAPSEKPSPRKTRVASFSKIVMGKSENIEFGNNQQEMAEYSPHDMAISLEGKPICPTLAISDQKRKVMSTGATVLQLQDKRESAETKELKTPAGITQSGMEVGPQCPASKNSSEDGINQVDATEEKRAMPNPTDQKICENDSDKDSNRAGSKVITPSTASRCTSNEITDQYGSSMGCAYNDGFDEEAVSRDQRTMPHSRSQKLSEDANVVTTALSINLTSNEIIDQYGDCAGSIPSASSKTTPSVDMGKAEVTLGLVRGQLEGRVNPSDDLKDLIEGDKCDSGGSDVITGSSEEMAHGGKEGGLMECTKIIQGQTRDNVAGGTTEQGVNTGLMTKPSQQTDLQTKADSLGVDIDPPVENWPSMSGSTESMKLSPAAERSVNAGSGNGERSGSMMSKSVAPMVSAMTGSNRLSHGVPGSCTSSTEKNGTKTIAHGVTNSSMMAPKSPTFPGQMLNLNPLLAKVEANTTVSVTFHRDLSSDESLSRLNQMASFPQSTVIQNASQRGSRSAPVLSYPQLMSSQEYARKSRLTVTGGIGKVSPSSSLAGLSPLFLSPPSRKETETHHDQSVPLASPAGRAIGGTVKSPVSDTTTTGILGEIAKSVSTSRSSASGPHMQQRYQQGMPSVVSSIPVPRLLSPTRAQITSQPKVTPVAPSLPQQGEVSGRVHATNVGLPTSMSQASRVSSPAVRLSVSPSQLGGSKDKAMKEAVKVAENTRARSPAEPPPSILELSNTMPADYKWQSQDTNSFLGLPGIFQCSEGTLPSSETKCVEGDPSCPSALSEKRTILSFDAGQPSGGEVPALGPLSVPQHSKETILVSEDAELSSKRGDSILAPLGISQISEKKLVRLEDDEKTGKKRDPALQPLSQPKTSEHTTVVPEHAELKSKSDAGDPVLALPTMSHIPQNTLMDLEDGGEAGRGEDPLLRSPSISQLPEVLKVPEDPIEVTIEDPLKAVPEVSSSPGENHKPGDNKDTPQECPTSTDGIPGQHSLKRPLAHDPEMNLFSEDEDDISSSLTREIARAQSILNRSRLKRPRRCKGPTNDAVGQEE